MSAWQPFLSDSPFELFFDCVGLALMIRFSFGVADDVTVILDRLRGR